MKKIAFILLTIHFTCCAWSQGRLTPTRLTCEYLANPIGIEMTHPRLGWNFNTKTRNQFQSAYEIIVNDKQDEILKGKGKQWHSGKIFSNQSLHIVYNGAPLQPFTKYFWRVRVYDLSGGVSGWSEPASFETSMLQQEDWSAKWIGDGSKQFERDEDFYQDDPMPLFRKQFIANKKIASARLYISGLGYYEAYLNNSKIGDHVLDPGFTSYRKQVQYVTHDITGLLKNGNNTIGIMLGNGWWNPLPLRLFRRFNLRDAQETGRPCVKALIRIQFNDGSVQWINTDETWETAAGPVIRNNVYLGEVYDARKEKSFSSAEGWKAASVATGPTGLMSSQLQPPIRITKTVQPVRLSEVGKDTFIVDMGQNFAGAVKIKVKGNAGTRISIRYGEDLFKDGRLNYLTTVAGQIKEIWRVDGGPGSPKTAWQKDEYILKGEGTEDWSPRFTFHGFRYIEISGWPGKPTLNDIEGLRMNTDIPLNGNFSCSFEPFNRLHEVIQWTFLSNIFSVQSDCPAREKMGYGGDMVATGEAFIYNYDMSQFYAKAIKDFANDQQPDGGITEIAPYTGIHDKGYGGESGPLGWQLAFPFLQKQVYQYYGDKKIIADYFPAFKKQIEFLQAKAIDGLFHWDISDHEALDPKPEGLSAAAFYYHHVLLATEFAGILGEKQDSIKYATLARNIGRSIVQKYYVPGTGRFDNATQSAQLFALWYGLAPDTTAATKILMDEFARHKNHISTGIFTTKMMFDVLREMDKSDLAYTLASQPGFPGWLHMINSGATTLWETWEYPDNAPSQNHPMFGSVDEWFYKSLLGINAGAPGFEKIIIKPQPVKEISWAKGSYRSVRGEIVSEWKKQGDGFSMKVVVPANTTAEIWIPGAEGKSVTESGRSVQELKELEIIGNKKGYLVIRAGGGSYDFSVN